MPFIVLTNHVQMTAKVQDVFGKYHTVLVYGKQDYETFRYKEKVKDAYAIFWKKAIFNGIMLVSFGDNLSFKLTFTGHHWFSVLGNTDASLLPRCRLVPRPGFFRCFHYFHSLRFERGTGIVEDPHPPAFSQ